MSDNSGASKRGAARSQAEAALRARREGEDDRADLLMEQAQRTDPEAVEELLSETGPHELTPDSPEAPNGVADDHELQLMTTQVQPGSDAPSRSGITGSGSGADSQDR